jgi:site-specific DNA-methyltransferase (adenine-specific)
MVDKTYTNENDIVLDNLHGVGSTGVACKNINRNWIEMENKYYEIAKKKYIVYNTGVFVNTTYR